jgi:hypothetical protein
VFAVMTVASRVCSMRCFSEKSPARAAAGASRSCGSYDLSGSTARGLLLGSLLQCFPIGRARIHSDRRRVPDEAVISVTGH